jgi:hypothetical protein
MEPITTTTTLSKSVASARELDMHGELTQPTPGPIARNGLGSLGHGLSLIGLLSIAGWLAFGAGCREEPLLSRLNLVPEARAGDDQEVAFAGQPVDVTLDGSGSSDTDGVIMSWQWFSAISAPDGGVAVPEGETPTWPEDAERPTVALPQGVWTFALWVEDDRGAVSLPDTVKITVGDPNPLADPEVAACAEGIAVETSDDCKACVCAAGDACRTSIAACDEVCWNLIGCVAANCPDFDAMASRGDYSCLVEHCMEFAGGGVAAMAAGPCVTGCDACTAAVVEGQ